MISRRAGANVRLSRGAAASRTAEARSLGIQSPRGWSSAGAATTGAASRHPPTQSEVVTVGGDDDASHQPHNTVGCEHHEADLDRRPQRLAGVMIGRYFRFDATHPPVLRSAVISPSTSGELVEHHTTDKRHRPRPAGERCERQRSAAVQLRIVGDADHVKPIRAAARVPSCSLEPRGVPLPSTSMPRAPVSALFRSCDLPLAVATPRPASKPRHRNITPNIRDCNTLCRCGLPFCVNSTRAGERTRSRRQHRTIGLLARRAIIDTIAVAAVEPELGAKPLNRATNRGRTAG